MRIPGSTPDGTYVEIIELPDHPHFIACQFHPEFKSKPLEPHPLFKTFVGASYEHGLKRRVAESSAEEVKLLQPEEGGRKKKISPNTQQERKKFRCFFRLSHGARGA